MKAFLIAAILAGCATAPERYLTQEEDAALRASCEPYGGCAAVPKPLWEKIESLLYRIAGPAI